MYFRNLTPRPTPATLTMLSCSTSLPAHRGWPVVLGGNMALRILDRLQEDGTNCISPTFHGRICRYFDLNVRRHPLKHAHSAPNSLRLNILSTTPAPSIFCADFRLSPPVFSIFYEHGGGGGGGALIEPLHLHRSAIGPGAGDLRMNPWRRIALTPRTRPKGLHP
jgi:hypothetical protein